MVGVEAVSPDVLTALICPHCAAMNRPGALIIRPDDPSSLAGWVVCGVCSYAWRLARSPEADRRAASERRREGDRRQPPS
jgi:hypothetical protein